jgi:exo-1,4-beta-D-glucosaminidase
MENSGEQSLVRVEMKNPTNQLAFFTKLELAKSGDGLQVAPSFWSDNYFSLLPGEQKTLAVSYDPKNLQGQPPVIRLSGWNINPAECIPR